MIFRPRLLRSAARNDNNPANAGFLSIRAMLLQLGEFPFGHCSRKRDVTVLDDHFLALF